MADENVLYEFSDEDDDNCSDCTISDIDTDESDAEFSK